jgi:hypothetical protein
MVQPVSSDAIENYGDADMSGQASEPYKSVVLRSLINKPAPRDTPYVIGRLAPKPNKSQPIQATEFIDIFSAVLLW